MKPSHMFGRHGKVDMHGAVCGGVLCPLGQVFFDGGATVIIIFVERNQPLGQITVIQARVGQNARDFIVVTGVIGQKLFQVVPEREFVQVIQHAPRHVVHCAGVQEFKQVAKHTGRRARCGNKLYNFMVVRGGVIYFGILRDVRIR